MRHVTLDSICAEAWLATLVLFSISRKIQMEKKMHFLSKNLTSLIARELNVHCYVMSKKNRENIIFFYVRSVANLHVTFNQKAVSLKSKLILCGFQRISTEQNLTNRKKKFLKQKRPCARCWCTIAKK